MSSWIWQDDIHVEDQAILGTRPPSIRARGLRFDGGVLLPPPEPDTAFEIVLSDDDDGVLTDNLVSPALPGLLISSRLRAVFEQNGVDNIQYFPVDLIKHDGSIPADRYFIANIIGRVMCVDFGRSVIAADPGPPLIIDSIERLVLLEDEIRDLDIFRLGELFVAIVVSSRLKDAIERSGVTGVKFDAVDDFIF